MNELQPGTTMYRIGELERVLREEIREAISMLSGELASAWTRIAELETRLHDHEQAVPHAEAQS